MKKSKVSLKNSKLYCMANVGITLTMLFCTLLSEKTLAVDFNPIIRFVENGRYEEALSELNKIDTLSIKNELDRSHYSFIKGGILYFQEKYREAIPDLEKGLIFSKTMIEQQACDYIENFYVIGDCYFQCEDYKNAERWFRKAIIASAQLTFICNIESKIYSELSQCYERTGRKDLVEDCLRHGETNLNRLNNLVSWEQRVENEYEYIDSYIEHNSYNSAEMAYERILDIINENVGKCNNDYLSYSCLFASFYVDQYYKDEKDTELLKKAFSHYDEILRIIYTSDLEFEYMDSIYLNYFDCLVTLNIDNRISEILNMAANYYANGRHNSGQNTMYLRLGEAYYVVGDYVNAVKYLSIPLFDKNIVDAKTIDIRILLEAMYITKDSSCLEFTELAKPIMEMKTSIAADDCRSFFQNAMYVYEDNNDIAKAIDAGNQALLCCKKEQQPRDLINILRDLAMLNSSSNIELTEQYIQDGQALFPYVEASDKLSFVITESYIYLSLERYEDAVCIIENILRDIPLGEDNESFYATLYHNLGRGYMLQNNCNEAIKYLEIAKNLQQKVNGSVNEKTEKYLKVCYAKKQ